MPVVGQGIKSTTTNVTGAQNIKITDLVVAIPASEYNHALTSNLKELIIKCRGTAKLQIAFNATESGTKFFTIPKGVSLALDGLEFSSKTLYLQTDKADTVEIVELY